VSETDKTSVEAMIESFDRLKEIAPNCSFIQKHGSETEDD
jgi:hypothetical protein